MMVRSSVAFSKVLSKITSPSSVVVRTFKKMSVTENAPFTMLGLIAQMKIIPRMEKSKPIADKMKIILLGVRLKFSLFIFHLPKTRILSC
jgi:hypothetical protein